MMGGMVPDALELAAAVEELASFLTAHGQSSLAARTLDCEQRIRRGDADAIEHLLTVVREMNPLVDVALHVSNDGGEFARLLDRVAHEASAASPGGIVYGEAGSGRRSGA